MSLDQVQFTKIIASLTERREPFAVATVVRTEGSSLAKPGFKVVISKEGEAVWGSLGGSCPESAIAGVSMHAMRSGTPRVVKVFLESAELAVQGVLVSQSEEEIHVETNCGGTMEIYIEPYLPTQRLVLVGQGGKDDVEDTLVSLGQSLGYEVIVIDHSAVLSRKPDLLIADPDYDISTFRFFTSDSVVVLTKGARDTEVLKALEHSGAGYVGLMASRQRAKDDLEALRAKGVDEGFIGSVKAPVGVDIGAVTPQEIALSIMTDVVASRHGKRLPGKSAPAEGHEVRAESSSSPTPAHH